MNKREAKEIISNQLDAYRKRPYSELVEMIDTDPITYKVNGPSGTSYQIEIAASWDDKPNGNIRVIGAIADHGLKAFAPMFFDESIKRTMCNSEKKCIYPAPTNGKNTRLT